MSQLPRLSDGGPGLTNREGREARRRGTLCESFSLAARDPDSGPDMFSSSSTDLGKPHRLFVRPSRRRQCVPSAAVIRKFVSNRFATARDLLPIYLLTGLASRDSVPASAKNHVADRCQKRIYRPGRCSALSRGPLWQLVLSCRQPYLHAQQHSTLCLLLRGKAKQQVSN